MLLSTGLALGLDNVGLGLHIIVLSCLYVMVNHILRPYMSQLVCIPRCLAVLQLLRFTAGLISVAVTAGVVVLGSLGVSRPLLGGLGLGLGFGQLA